ncbi:MAG: NADP-dependent isocitrate dehydrogenase [Planctomycetota bacterium]|nr:MAG: NADP-dependent isocitrate dehydrogenase [Planctomycetota bacterium]
MTTQQHIIYTHTDEAPALATYCLLPIVRRFAASSGVTLESRDISLSGRILAQFPDFLRPEQRIADELSALGSLATKPEANIIKLPNISASLPQLNAAISELQEQGFAVPDYPVNPSDEREADIKARYSKVLGSAVNPVLREGNSDRRAPLPVKGYARKHPHSMGAWSKESRTTVAHMHEGDFFGSEQSHTIAQDDEVRIEFIDAAGSMRPLRDPVPVLAGEVIDAAVMSQRHLRAFLHNAIAQAEKAGVLFSVHLKATMMKVSDPIIFGHAVTTYFDSVFAKHGQTLAQLGVNPNNGLGDLYAKLQDADEATRTAIDADIAACYAQRPPLAMVDSDRGITNLHVPSDVIIDASMPAAIRAGGIMWGPDGKPHDTVAVIPDRSYAGVYQETINFCKEHGAFDPTTMGSIPNVGLMAKKAEEYGSHDKTFEIPAAGTVRVRLGDGSIVMEHSVEAGDIWRMCQTKDVAIQDWVGLAVRRARATGAPAIFWLNSQRAHDAQLIAKVEAALPQHDTSGLDIRILAPVEATRLSLQRAKDGLDTISVTGNVLRDYLTDLFPILELGTSAKMLSIVPLLAGGGLYETGAGGSAPKHVQQFVKEGHLRWDSLGEYLALAVSLEDLGRKSSNRRAQILADTLNQATAGYLNNNKSPSRKVNELDNRGSHFYLALYWAQALAGQDEDSDLAEEFRPIAEALVDEEEAIVRELNAAQGAPVDIGGYYHPDHARTSRAMLASATLNRILNLEPIS